MKVEDFAANLNTLPTFFIVGAAKSGTTAIYQYLTDRSDVYMCPVKEPNYFSDDIDTGSFREDYKQHAHFNIDKYIDSGMKDEVHIAFIREFGQYLRLFQSAEDITARGEMSNSYLFSTNAAQNIRNCLPDSRIIMILRNPYERVLSHYKMDLHNGLIKSNFYEALYNDYNSHKKGWGITNLYVELSLYAKQVARYLKCFPRDQLLILSYDDFRKDNIATFKKILNFIGVNENNLSGEIISANKSKQPRFPGFTYFLKQSGIKDKANTILPAFIRKSLSKLIFKKEDDLELDERSVNFLSNIFRPDITELSDLTGIDFSSWDLVNEGDKMVTI